MTSRNLIGRWAAIAAVFLGLSASSGSAFAHCDTLDGPVVAAARKALDTGNVNLVLIWVQKKDEADIRKQFEKTVAVRKAGGQAKELADMYFFETLVRVRTRDGRTLERLGLRRSLDAQAVLEKYRGLVKGVVSDERAERIPAAIAALDAQADVRAVGALLAAE